MRQKAHAVIEHVQHADERLMSTVSATADKRGALLRRYPCLHWEFFRFYLPLKYLMCRCFDHAEARPDVLVARCSSPTTRRVPVLLHTPHYARKSGEFLNGIDLPSTICGNI